MELSSEEITKIRVLNDQFRQTFDRQLGKAFITRGVSALPALTQMKIMILVRTYDDFNHDNDPHGEHSFGNFTVDGNVINWKIDYHVKELEYGSEHPENVEETSRVLTVMLREEN